MTDLPARLRQHVKCACWTCEEYEEAATEIESLRRRLEKSEAVCVAAASVFSEESYVRDNLLCFVMGAELIERLAAWHGEAK